MQSNLDASRGGKLPGSVTACWTLVGVIVALIGFNQYLLFRLSPARATGTAKSSGAVTANNPGATASNGNSAQDTISLVVTTGIPRTYGSELNVSYDQVQQSMNVMGAYDPDYGSIKIALTPDEQKRYIAIGGRISCEYCCGAKSIVFPSGKAACGCAHSQAMRGLMAYLLSKHGTEYTDDQILQELARWKGRFFPKQMITKMDSQRASGQYTPDIAALLMNVPNASSGGSPGGSAPLPSSLQNLPNMVGGC